MSVVDGTTLWAAQRAWATLRRAPYSEARAERRRAFAIHGYTGSNGGGKSLAMVHDTLPSLDAGRVVLSTVRLLDYRDPHMCGEREHDVCDDPTTHAMLGAHPAAHRCYVPFRDFRQLWPLVESGGDVLMDEVTGVASSRESHGLPVQVVNLLMQLRRADIQLRFTTPNYARADKVLREVCQAVTDCAGYSPVTATRDDGTRRVWRNRRMFRWETFDAFAFDEFTTHKRDTLEPLVTQWYWRPGDVVERAYSTLDPVLSLGWANEAGLCMTCGGRRSVPRCSCADHGGSEESDTPKRIQRRVRPTG